jgi:2-amino-4-hydroxy-6-hydroxymethyldihydropteridine diphosphokinase
MRLAAYAIAATAGVDVRACSRIVRSPPAGGVATRPFLNAVIVLDTTLSPTALLARCRAIEARLGRRPARRWADRVLDIDVLLYGDARLDAANLRIPHPGILARDFVLQPLAEVWPDARDPATRLPYRDAAAIGRRLPIVGTLPRVPIRADAADAAVAGGTAML